MTEFVSKTANNAADTPGSPVLFAMTDMLRHKASAKDVRFPIKEIFLMQGRASCNLSLSTSAGGSMISRW